MDFNDKVVLLIGGTGSFGTAFLRHLLASHPEIKDIRIMSRDEQKQYELATTLNEQEKRKVTFFIGDVRDRNRLLEVLTGVHIVVYAAAMKHMPIAETNPEECFKTNIQGTQNLIDAALIHKIEKVIALSTDKAVMPINTYGASKLFLEKIIVSANRSPRNVSTQLSAVRYANVLGSRGSVVPFFQRMKATGVLPITDRNMTRFSITMQESIDIVMFALQHGQGGEIFVPKAPSYKITTVAEAIAPECALKDVGIRQSEKLSELMLSRFEASRTVERKNCYVVLPFEEDVAAYLKKQEGERVASDFEYDSATNARWLSVEELRTQIAAL